MDVAKGELVEGELDRLVEKRHDRRVTHEGERPAEEAWMQSERKYDARRRAENGAAWVTYHTGQAARHKAVLEALISRHEAEAEKYADKLGIDHDTKGQAA